MGYPFYTRRHTFFDGTVSGTNVSGNTSQPWLVADFVQMSLSWNSAGTTSTLTVWGTNEDGLNTSITTWSAITGLTSQGIYAIEPGFRWMRVTRASGESLGIVVLQSRT